MVGEKGRGPAGGRERTHPALAEATGHLRAERYQEAEALYREVLRENRRDAQAWDGLGVLAYQTGRMALAKECFERAIALKPKVAEHHNHLGIVCRAEGKPKEALAHYRRAIQLGPPNAGTFGNYGNALRDLERFDEAIENYREALRLAPHSTPLRISLGATLVAAKRAEEGLEILREAVRLDPQSAAPHKELGNALLSENFHDEAVACYRRATALDPSDHKAHHNMGTALQFLGHLDEAAEHYRKAVALKPDFSASLRQLGGVKKFDSPDQDVSELEALVKRQDLTEDQRAELYLALAKAYDDLGQYDKAFARLQAGNQILRKGLDYSADKNTQYVDRIIAAFTAEFFAERRSFGSDSDVPIFIIGMPRSGTTLVEQIICSHPRVYGAGELMRMHEMVTEFPRRLRRKAHYPEAMRLIDREMAGRLAAEYLDYLRGFDAEADHITDKMPFNFRMLGLIALLFPRAHFIHCVRDPLDVCLSCYFARFKDRLMFTFNLVEVGGYYRDYATLMDHWREVLPVPMLEVRYEELVADQEAKSREMISFCGLEWDDRCLAFYETERPVLTASNWQVRQPIYRTSIERWRHYERYLGPLMDALGDPRVRGSQRGAVA
jgi:tetratricopeptide (TPR) repeat protein